MAYKYKILFLLIAFVTFSIISLPIALSQPQLSVLLDENFNDKNKITGQLFGEIDLLSVGPGDNAITINGLTGSVGYEGKILNTNEGTIRFWWSPPPDLIDFYTSKRPEWKSYKDQQGNVIEPPRIGFLLDDLGFFEPEPGNFHLYLYFENQTTAYLVWAVYDGKSWQSAEWEHSPDFWKAGQSYLIVVSYGPKGLALYVDSSLKAHNPDYTGGVNIKYPFFIGQTQVEGQNVGKFYPFGPHSMKGIYDDFKIYNRQVHYVPYELTLPNEIFEGKFNISGKLPEQATIYVNLVSPSGKTRSYKFTSQPDGTYMIVLDLNESGTWSLGISTFLPNSLVAAYGYYKLDVKKSGSTNLEWSYKTNDPLTVMLIIAVVVIGLVLLFKFITRKKERYPQYPPQYYYAPSR
ncbi:MAG: hypothetical protein DRJ35_07820 [Thermoprotei archaeon]|nr:MAG: hypothetical protein DRJ35_07820 [Thermoprotei archaeon]